MAKILGWITFLRQNVTLRNAATHGWRLPR